MLYIFVEYLLVFFIGATLGYIIELFYRRFVSQKKWMNPGFLTGPCLPIYGFGVVCLYLICEIAIPVPRVWEVIIKSGVILVMMTLIELVAGLIFINGLKIKLWDYTDRWGNYKGVICPLYSFLWGVVGFFYLMFIHPLINDVIEIWSKNQILSFFVGSGFGIFVVDLCISFHLANKIRAFAKEHEVVVHYEIMKSSIKEVPGKLKDRIYNSTEQYRERIDTFMKIESKEDRYAMLGFFTSFVGFLAFPLGLCLVGLKSESKKKYAIAGLAITITEIIALFVCAFIFMI